MSRIGAIPRRIFVTGAAGRLGSRVIARLRAVGHGAAGFDRVPGEGVDHIGDCTDPAALRSAMQSCDALLHLSAIPSPGGVPDTALVANNAVSTHAVLAVARELGIGKAVVASSISILGTAYAPSRVLPLYAPVDEDHPLNPYDAYALSKAIDQLTCESVARTSGMSISLLRFAAICEPHRIAGMAALAASDPEAQPRRVRILWSYVEQDDAVDACLCALATPHPGARAFNITASDTLSPLPTRELLGRFAPEVRLCEPLDGFASAWSIDRAGRELGYSPRFSWRGGVGA